MELRDLRGIGKTYEKKLNEAGIKSVEKLALANEKEIASKIGVKQDKIKKWKEEARRIIGIANAEIIDDIPKISFIEIEDDKARVKIKEYWHNAKLYKGNFDEIKSKIEKEKVAVYLSKKPKLWFNGKWHDKIPYKIKKKWWRWRK
ncbi:MAG: DUF4332 domain-containing protein [Thermoplasmata archaeon]|nr:DUF4332 domain-containing protein [Thermoplasmata archaeon]